MHSSRSFGRSRPSWRRTTRSRKAEISHRALRRIQQQTGRSLYAYDYCYLTGVYLPRVWWTQRSLAKMKAGVTVAADLVTTGTVAELSANALYQWLVDWSAAYGWRKVGALDQMQAVANGGGVAVICGRSAHGSGHISVVAPESAGHQATRKDGRVVLPTQSQAGGTNLEYGQGHAWWTGAEFTGGYGLWAID